MVRTLNEVVAAIFVCILPVVSGGCTSIPYPRLLRECYDDISEKFSTTDYPGELPSIICINKFRWWTDSESCHPTIHPGTLHYVRDLSDHHGRYKRGVPRQKRKRKEIRMLTKRELKRFFKALKLLKTKKLSVQNTQATLLVANTSVSIYDAIAGIHNGDIARTAHIGPNFLSWHRIYLYTFENALHAVQPGVVLPYWDCTLEQGLESPQLSKFFSKTFLGKAKGKLKKSRFGNSPLLNIVRNIGSGGPLPSRLDVAYILTRNRTKDIVVPFANAPYNLEYLHNGIHTYVGGHLATLENATMDPIFFLLHCFIDYVFEKFRQRLKSLGIDPTTDIPDPGEYYLGGLHRPDVTMSVFENYTNADGYSDYWTDEIYEYEDSPSTCETECGCDHLVCIKGLCYPKTGRGAPIPRKLNEEELRYFKASKPIVDGINKTVSGNENGIVDKGKSRKKRESSLNKRKKRSASVQFDNQVCSGFHCPGSNLPIQNIFSINGGRSDVDEWVFIAVKVTFFRPLNLHFHTFQMHNNSIDESHDIFDPYFSKNLQSAMHVGHQGTYRNFCRVNSGGAGKVFVRSDGLNYNGYSMEYALVDERHPISTGTAYVPIKSPAKYPTEVSLIAYDECGRTCMPTCLVKASSPPKYIPCTGCLRFDHSSPACYGKTVADLIYNMWNFGPQTGSEECPSAEHSSVHVNFLCDSSDLYPWDRI
ncbi:uncharacterized protein LOC132558532 [Ylistrum balloti]|uniref:uncharacterized protein LOC132558532 n=1 Tax=Ylistrum balloti TaxID=509963 RepID=UPI002905DD5F|nr:uncharacterized protein LOC132558532 [Ylistrum balloti]